jgi:hypothetical protein
MNSILAIDRDGVLFDTCRLNIDSYISATKDLGLNCERNHLGSAVHSGLSFSDFYKVVWGALDCETQSQLKEAKSNFFRENLGATRLNIKVLEKAKSFCDSVHLVTRASLSSSFDLLNHYRIEYDHANIHSTQTGLDMNKTQILKAIASDNSIDNNSIIVLDDSAEIVRELIESGFNARKYPHFCAGELQ